MWHSGLEQELGRWTLSYVPIATSSRGILLWLTWVTILNVYCLEFFASAGLIFSRVSHIWPLRMGHCPTYVAIVTSWACYARLARPCLLAWRHCHFSGYSSGPWATANKEGQRCHPSASTSTLWGRTNMKIVEFALFANFLSHVVEHMVSQGWGHMEEHEINWDGWMQRGRQPQTGLCRL